jgi:hypothetical protein
LDFVYQVRAKNLTRRRGRISQVGFCLPGSRQKSIRRRTEGSQVGFCLPGSRQKSIRRRTDRKDPRLDFVYQVRAKNLTRPGGRRIPGLILSTRFSPNLIRRKKDPRLDFVYQFCAKNPIRRKKGSQVGLDMSTSFAPKI